MNALMERLNVVVEQILGVRRSGATTTTAHYVAPTLTKTADLAPIALVAPAPKTVDELKADLLVAVGKMDLRAIESITAELQERAYDEEKALREHYLERVRVALETVVRSNGLADICGLTIKGGIRRTDTGLNDLSIPVVSIQNELLNSLNAAIAIEAAPLSLKSLTYTIQNGVVTVETGAPPKVKGRHEGQGGKGEEMIVDGVSYASASKARVGVLGEVNPKTGNPWTPANRKSITSLLEHTGHRVS